MRMVSIFMIGGALAVGAPAGEPTAVTFTQRPTVTKAGDKATLSFAVSAPTDVEVAVLGADGKVVRHLEAGILGGERPPPEPLKPGLAQALAWDGKDDDGIPVDAKGCKFRVRAGMKPVLDGFLLDNPVSSGPVKGVAVRPNGEVYIFHRDPTANGNMGDDKIKVLSRDGKHLRAVKPFSASLPLEKVKAFGAATNADGNISPIVQNWEQLSIYPDPVKARGRSRPDCSSPAVDSRGRVYWPVFGPAIACLEADGSAPADGFIGPRLLADIKDLCMSNIYRAGAELVCLAVSGDGKYLYLAGLRSGKFEKEEERKGVPCVFRVPVEKRDTAEVFVGKPDSPGTEKDALTAPVGLAVAKGLLYVTDRQADRVAAFKEVDRSYVGEIKVKAPQSVAVDPETGAIYVVAVTGRSTAEIIKFDSIASGKEVCRVALASRPDLSTNYRLAADTSTRPVRLWLPGMYGTNKLLCFEDAGAKLEPRDDPRDLKTPWAEGPRDLAIDRIRNELYVKVNRQWYRFDELTGKIKDTISPKIKLGLDFGAAGTMLTPSPDGSLIAMSWSVGFQRFDHDGKLINLPGQNTNCIPYGGMMTFQERALAVPKADEFLAVLPNYYRIKDEAERKKIKTDAHSVDVIGPDGSVKRTVIWQCTRGAVLRTDRQGNIYLAEPVKPVGRNFPEFFNGKIEPMKRSASYTEVPAVSYWNSYMYGSIIKFPPSGGAIWFEKDKKISPSAEGTPPAELLAKPVMKAQGHLIWNPATPIEIQGAEWMRFGYSGCSLQCGSDLCMCESSGFDVDAYGRVFYPNLGQFRVEMVDANNNFIGTFGRYGNQDDPSTSSGQAGARDADIPLTWPLTVAVSDTHAYVADTVSRRVVRVKLDYQTAEECGIK